MSDISATLTGFKHIDHIDFFIKFLILHAMQQKGSYSVKTNKSQVKTNHQITSKNKPSNHKQKQVFQQISKNNNHEITSKKKLIKS